MSENDKPSTVTASVIPSTARDTIAERKTAVVPPEKPEDLLPFLADVPGYFEMEVAGMDGALYGTATQVMCALAGAFAALSAQAVDPLISIGATPSVNITLYLSKLTPEQAQAQVAAQQAAEQAVTEE